VAAFFLLLGVSGMWTHHYMAGGWTLLLSLGATAGLIETLRDNRVARRRRYMGKATEKIAAIEGIKEP
jgi:hypothetical protein